MNRFLLLGHKGFLGSKIFKELRLSQREDEVLTTDTRFEGFASRHNFRALLQTTDVQTIINCVGAIDSELTASRDNTIIAHVLLPTFLYEYSIECLQRQKKLKIISFSSTSINSPRPKYPIYAGAKTFENVLFLSAKEAFSNSCIRWSQITLPALDGGLRLKISKPSAETSSFMFDKHLFKIMDFIFNSEHGELLQVN